VHLDSGHRPSSWKKCDFDARWLEFEVEIEPRANGQAICSGCGEMRPGYDLLSPKRGQMPQLATTIVDERAVSLIREWIESLGPQPATVSAR
jgi:hypothetical protein